MNKKIYTGFSLFQLLWTLALRLICVFGIFIATSNYEENPVVILIAILICLILLLIIGDDQIVLYEKNITQTTNSFWNLIFKSKGKTYQIEEIRTAYLQKKSSKSEIGVAVLLAFCLPKNSVRSDKSNPIFFELLNGDTARIETNLTTNQVERIVELVNSLVNQNRR